MHEHGDHPATHATDRLLAECEKTRTRRSGPGGQHRNKVETAVVLVHRPTGATAQASERRSQPENLAVAIDRLRRTLAVTVRTERSADGVPSDLWRSRCRRGRLSVSPDHADYPVLLAEALDVLAACDWDVPAAASQLGCTSSQLVKFLKDEPRALQVLNAERAARGLPPLR